MKSELIMRRSKRPFVSARDEAKESKAYSRESLQQQSPSYKIAFLDEEFLLREELRPVRLQLELLKPELLQQEQNIEATVVVFGSARIHAKDKSEEHLRLAKLSLAADPTNPKLQLNVKTAQSLLDKSKYYDEARRFGRIISRSNREHGHGFVVITGGGPGIMEAANRGAHDENAPSLGMSIVLPREEKPNAYVTPELSFRFHYFALRKMHFLMRARALVAFPGGFGTMDELFETLTLMQTHKIRHVPILLFGGDYWHKLINFQAFVDEGVISPEDLNLFDYVETAEEAWAKIAHFYNIPVEEAQLS
jgi:uncharacterized protein (TIGR00730 family)